MQFVYLYVIMCGRVFYSFPVAFTCLFLFLSKILQINLWGSEHRKLKLKQSSIFILCRRDNEVK